MNYFLKIVLNLNYFIIKLFQAEIYFIILLVEIKSRKNFRSTHFLEKSKVDYNSHHNILPS